MDLQLWTANYLALMAARANGPFTAVDHSKGANLALYVAVATTPPALKHVYAFDPVGFSTSVIGDSLFLSTGGRIHIYVIIGSRVSPLLPLPTPTTVVTLSWPGPLDHNPYAWHLQKSTLTPDHWQRSRSGLTLRDTSAAVLRIRPIQTDTNCQHRCSRWTLGPFHTHVGPFPCTLIL